MDSVALEPLEGVLAVLGSGAATGSNKFGLLLALIDLAPTLPTDGRLDLDPLCLKLIEIHWRHIEPFSPRQRPGDESISLQHHGQAHREPTVLKEVARLRSALDQLGQPSGSFHLARTLLPAALWQQSIRSVRRDTVRNPLTRLQVIAGQQIPFLYDLEPDCLRLNGPAARMLVVHGPLLRQLVEFRFSRHVISRTPALRNSIMETAVAEHLFGDSREMPGTALREDLVDLQAGRCFYTGLPLPRERRSLDHVLPWVMLRESSLSNFVMTSGDVNSSKSGLLVAPVHLDAWATHMTSNMSHLAELADRYQWEWEPAHNIASLRSFYRQSPDGAPLWSAKSHVVALNPAERSAAVSILDGLLEAVA